MLPLPLSTTTQSVSFFGQPPAISSYAAVRKADNSIAVAVGPSPAPGNWLRVAGSGEMRLVLLGIPKKLG